MKRVSIAVCVALLSVILWAPSASAAWGGGYCPRASGTLNGIAPGFHPAAGYGTGPQQFGPNMGPRFMGSRAYRGYSILPSVSATQLEFMLNQMKTNVAILESQLADTTDDSLKTWYTYRLELMRLQIGWLEGRIPVVSILTTDTVEAQIALAGYDVEFYSSAVSSDATVQQVIADRLQDARLALAYWETHQDDTQN